MSAVDDARRDVELCRRAHTRLLDRLDDVLVDAPPGSRNSPAVAPSPEPAAEPSVAPSVARSAGGPSRLEGWTRAELVTHLARNADSHRRMFEEAAAGRVVDQYPGGMDERDGGIAAGREATARAVTLDLRTAVHRLEEAWSATDWTGAGRRGGHETTPLTDLPFLRLREVELHHVDLDVGHEFCDLDPVYARLEERRLTMRWTARRPMGLTSLPPAVLASDPHDRLAWLTGRSQISCLATPSLF